MDTKTFELFDEDAAREIGLGHGRDHANYVNAYGGPTFPDTIDVPGNLTRHADAYREAYRVGVETVMDEDVAGWREFA